jgi:hypothetical protein
MPQELQGTTAFRLPIQRDAHDAGKGIEGTLQGMQRLQIELSSIVRRKSDPGKHRVVKLSSNRSIAVLNEKTESQSTNEVPYAC